MTVEKNKVISKNFYINEFFNSPYELASINMSTGEIPDFYRCFKLNILSDVEQYNHLSLCKFYYESENKDLLPSKFKDHWRDWHSSQIWTVNKCKEYMTKFPNCHINNFIKKDLVYNELKDNMLIIGAGILSKVYLYQKLYHDYHPNIYVPKVQFYTKAWFYYVEALTEYAQFFEQYNSFCKLHILQNCTKSDIWFQMFKNQNFQKGVESIPPLREDILNWPVKPTWYNKIRPENTKPYISNPIEPGRPFFKEGYMSLRPIIARDLCNDLYKKPVDIKDFYLYRSQYLWKLF